MRLSSLISVNSPLVAVILFHNITFIEDHITYLQTEWLAGSNRHTFKRC